MRWLILGMAGVTSIMPGCGGYAPESNAYYRTAASIDSGEAQGILNSPGSSPQESTAQQSTETSNGEMVSRFSNPVQTTRKIIYNTRLGLVVKSYAEFESQLPRLVEAHGGFISQSETNRRYNNQQSGTWTARVPVDKYNQFMAGVTGLGFAETRREDAQDVTDEFVDVEARIRNSRTLESRIVKMLEERTGKIADVLEIERELSRVREEIERMEGRLRLLSDRTSLATVVIQCREEQQYTPPAAPTLGSRLGETWSGSIAMMRLAGEGLLIAIVAIAPWLVLFSIPIWLFVRTTLRLLSPKVTGTQVN